ncbi:pantetheine-phosphate adenylyltransferase [Prochlorococcus marinus]|uniref:pantetheine-phosphate adenylyltransferase n=1 Tax=Prochlorococcus marinus TaxID=1219 RepID=UPI0022B2C064|nr:pantetheine-phosphate adenylyltransferase [Prochlorococcus marinus]
MKVLYPGSFDPLTYGHLDLVQRASERFGDVIIAILDNPTKVPTFSIERRIQQINSSISNLQGIRVISYRGLTVQCAKKYKVDLILRGLRAMSDFEYELQIAHTNRTLDNSIETIFLATESHHSFLSSSVVKEVALFGGKVDHMVPPIVATDLYQINNKNK